jgi:hypothetical protein
LSHLRRTGLAAILAGVLYFAGQGGELAFDGDQDGEAVFIAFGTAGFVALGVALWGLREIVSGTRRGRIGIWLALVGFAFLGAFAVQLIVEQIGTGEVPENFALFGLGFLLVLIGQLLFAWDLRAAVGWAWVFPLVATAGLIVALAVTTDPIHDIGLFIFEAAWVALGSALLRAERAAAA